MSIVLPLPVIPLSPTFVPSTLVIDALPLIDTSPLLFTESSVFELTVSAVVDEASPLTFIRINSSVRAMESSVLHLLEGGGDEGVALTLSLPLNKPLFKLLLSDANEDDFANSGVANAGIESLVDSLQLFFGRA